MPSMKKTRSSNTTPFSDGRQMPNIMDQSEIMKEDDLSEYNNLEDSFLMSQKNKRAPKPMKEQMNSSS